jgi:hypothetical protein
MHIVVLYMYMYICFWATNKAVEVTIVLNAYSAYYNAVVTLYIYVAVQRRNLGN